MSVVGVTGSMTCLIGRCLASSGFRSTTCRTLKGSLLGARQLSTGRGAFQEASPDTTKADSEGTDKKKNAVGGSFLRDFFDHPEHWGKERVRVGRSWTQPELRLKSNEDLHKLWYILLKERNMLLTMEEAYKVEALEMPNPERLDKVDESMENVEYVVRERNRAYFELETGVSGEAERRIQTGPFGLPVGYTPKEHAVPWKLNAEYRKFLRYRYQTCNSPSVKKFVRKYVERRLQWERVVRMEQMRLCAQTLQRFPDASEEGLRERFPLIDVDQVKRWKKVKGHHGNFQWNV